MFTNVVLTFLRDLNTLEPEGPVINYRERGWWIQNGRGGGGVKINPYQKEQGRGGGGGGRGREVLAMLKGGGGQTVLM